MTIKIVLPYRVANAVNKIKAYNSDVRALCNYPAIANHAKTNPEYKVINDYLNECDANFKNYFNAIVNGFEADKPPLEKFKERYEFYLANNLKVSANALKEAIELLDIKIDGVNN